MQDDILQKIENTLYQTLSNQLDKKWDHVLKVIEAAAGRLGGHLIIDMVYRVVTVNVEVVTSVSDIKYYDRDLMKFSDEDLPLGSLYVHPYTKTLRMVGVLPNQKLAESSKKSEDLVKRVSDKTFLCKSIDGKWYEIRYDHEPFKKWFANPDKYYGHFEKLYIRSIGYTRKMLSEKSLDYFGLEND